MANIWIKCDTWDDLPKGMWLVKMEDGDYSVAEKLEDNKPIFVGTELHYDMSEPVAYTTFDKYGED